jgi:uridine kinase
LHFDDYAAVSSYPEDVRVWMDAGADVREWRTPRLTEDLRRLKAGHAIEVPGNQGAVEPAAFIVLEGPFGRTRPEIAGLIDFVVFVDVPMDVALVRRILRDFDNGVPRYPDGYAARLHEQLLTYLSVQREAYLLGVRFVRASCDLVVNGMRPADELAETIAAAAGGGVGKKH